MSWYPFQLAEVAARASSNIFQHYGAIFTPCPRRSKFIFIKINNWRRTRKLKNYYSLSNLTHFSSSQNWVLLSLRKVQWWVAPQQYSQLEHSCNVLDVFSCCQRANVQYIPSPENGPWRQMIQRQYFKRHVKSRCSHIAWSLSNVLWM
jgi:hypothetical protein